MPRSFLAVVVGISLLGLLACAGQRSPQGPAFALQPPAGWVSERVESPFFQSDLAIGLRPADWLSRRAETDLDVAEYAVYAVLYAATLETACEGYGICRDAVGQWSIAGRFGVLNPATELRINGRRVIRGLSETGEYDENGHVGAATALVAMMDIGHGHVVEFVSDPQFTDEATFDLIVASLRVK